MSSKPRKFIEHNAWWDAYSERARASQSASTAEWIRGQLRAIVTQCETAEQRSRRVARLRQETRTPEPHGREQVSTGIVE